MGTGQQAVVVAGRRCGRLCHHRMPLPPPRVAPLLPAAAAISALACISVQPRVLVPGQREGMEASLWPMSRPVPQLQSFRVISALARLEQPRMQFGHAKCLLYAHGPRDLAYKRVPLAGTNGETERRRALASCGEAAAWIWPYIL